MKRTISAVLAMIMLLSVLVVIPASADNFIGSAGTTNGEIVFDGDQDWMYEGSLVKDTSGADDAFSVSNFSIIFSEDFKTMYVSAKFSVESIDEYADTLEKPKTEDFAGHYDTRDAVWFGVDFLADGTDVLTARMDRLGNNTANWAGKESKVAGKVYNGEFTEKDTDNELELRSEFEWMIDVSEYGYKKGDTIRIAFGAYDYTDSPDEPLYAAYNSITAENVENWGGVRLRELYDYTIKSDGYVIINKFSGVAPTNYTLPTEFEGHTVNETGSYCFERNMSLVNVTVPDCYRIIGYRSFSWCSCLESITYPDTVEEIGGMAHYHNDVLKSVRLPDTMEKIPDAIFRTCLNLTEFTYPSACTEIGVEAFYNNHFSDLTIPEGITSIGDRAFYASAGSATDCTIPSTVEYIGSEAFDYINATQIYFNAANCTIKSDAFAQDYRHKFIAPRGSDAANLIEEFIVDRRETGIDPGNNRVHTYDPKSGFVYQCTDDTHVYSDYSVIKAPGGEGKTGQKARICYYCGIGAGAFSGGRYNPGKKESLKWDEYVAAGKGTTIPSGNNLPYIEFEWTKTGDSVEWDADYKADLLTLVGKAKEAGVELVHPWMICKHKNTEAVTAAVDATCENDGTTAGVKCADCGTVLEEPVVLKALGHDLGEWITDVEPTETTEGHRYKACSRCDYKVEETLPVTTHVHEEGEQIVDLEPTCTEEGKYHTVCVSCGNTVTEGTIPALDHDIVPHEAQAPTCTEIGWDAYDTCTRCDYTTYVEIPANGHSFEEGACTVCGARDQDYRIANPFKDVKKKDWFYDDVLYAVTFNLFSGTTATTFEPNTKTTRAMLVNVLWRIDGSPEPTTANKFTDVSNKKSNWYLKAVTWAAENKIVAGVGDGTKFDPNGNVTREQIASILFGYAKFKGMDVTAKNDITTYPDYKKVSKWARDYLAWANAEGLITGAVQNGKTVLDPQGEAVRSVVASILVRFVKGFMA